MTNLHLPDDPRAKALLAEMDARFFVAIEDLPDPLRALAQMRGTYDGTDDRGRFEGLSSMNPGLTCTPWMFWEISSGIDDERFVDIAFGGGTVILSSILLDHLADNQVVQAGKTTLLQAELQALGSSQLRQVFGPKNDFWDQHDRLLGEHRRGLAEELQWRKEPDRLTETVFVEAISAKFAPIALTMVATALAAQRNDLAQMAERSIKHLAVASQLLDDLGDWQDDRQAHRLTWFIKSLDPDFDWTAEEWPSAEELQGHIDANWSEIKLLNWAMEWLNRSKDAVDDINCPAWLRYLDGFREITEGHLSGRTARHLARSIEELLPGDS